MSKRINDESDKTQVFLRGNGDVVFINQTKISEPTIEGTALALKRLGEKKVPLHEDQQALAERHSEAVEAVLNEWALFALGLIEAAHRGDHTVFRNIHRAMTKKEKPMDEIKNILAKEARKEKRMPTAHEIAAGSKEIGEKGMSGDQFTNPRNIKNNLAKGGITVKSRKKGRPKKT
jgi:hypothetical protein